MLILRRLSFWARFRLCALAFLLLPVAMSVTAQVPFLTTQMLAQAAIGGRADRTPAEEKLDSTLMFALRSLAGAQGQISLSQQASIQSFVNQNVATDQTIFIVIKAKVSPDLVKALHSAVAYDISEFPQYDTITARVPVEAILNLALRTDVLSIGPQELSVTNRYFPTPEEIQAWPGAITNAGSVTWQGLTAHKANIWQSAGITGSGVKVCVLSDGVDSLAARQASGDLGAVTVLAGQSGHVVNETHDEGTAMLEIVHDMAPGASLAFATGTTSTAQFATNIQNLRTVAGCDIIVDDVSYYNEGAFQDDIVAQAVNTVTADGAMYFSSAADSGNLTHGTSGTFEGDFVPSAAKVPNLIANFEGGPVILHSFGVNPYTTLTYPTNVVSLKWSDPLAGSGNDYDLFVLDSTGTAILGSSTLPQFGIQDPYEQAGCSIPNCPYPIGSRIYIVKYSGVTRALRLDTNRGRISNGTTGSTYGHNAAASALTVAAVNVATANGGAFVGGATNPVESYSSDGPRKMFYNPDGTAITPGNILFTTNGGTTLAKVDLAASDCGSTATTGSTPFCGTSAAAPTAAAIAALIKSANPSASNAQITAALLNSALDIEAAGIDRDSGVGIVMAPAAPVTLPTAPTIGTAIPGNTSISVAFAPGAIGSGSLISYWADCTKDYSTFVSAAGSNSPINVTGLVNGSAYSCKALTQSTVGYSPWSALSNTVIPAAPPGAPTNITVTPYPGRLQVSFTQPVDTGGSTVTGYTVTCTAAGQTTRTNTGASSPISVYGLTPGVAYSCTVTASNTAATSAPSTPVVTTTSRSIDLTPILMLLLDD